MPAGSFSDAEFDARTRAIMRGLQPLAADVATRFAHLAAESLEQQSRIEAADTMPFEAFRQQYLSPVHLG